MKKKELSKYITSRLLVAHPEDTAGDVLKRIKNADWDETQYKLIIKFYIIIWFKLFSQITKERLKKREYFVQTFFTNRFKLFSQGTIL